MPQILISKINGVDIVTVDRDGEIFVPIKPICEAIGIDAKAQRAKLQEDEFFASTGAIITSVAADEKEREMYCIRLRDVYGWLATINPGKVAPEAREAVTRYRRECYDVLYEHFTGSMRRTIETNNAEIELLQQINSAISDEKEAKGRRKKAEEALGKLRAERLNPQPSLF
ncbi:MAG: phage antirepressor N-terminal domain-containing protein [Duncaniella sp.]|uniref:phage antirepressor N-terminal domain-containing protein n=1 Tax=Duncaniella sp. TaxID=2518496 RepID=UPI0023BEEDD2|nr:phage antirepressor N-terminal domain-containing protein [Duncaniella sp.]MDE5988932.1 phage antirepressor N-terminal domain-containing protein [Duncaniella sp.]